MSKATDVKATIIKERKERMKPVIRRILEELKNNKMSVSELCRRTGIPTTTFSNYIHRGGVPRIEVLEAIADELRVPVSYLRTGMRPQENLEETMRSLIDRISVMPAEHQEIIIQTVCSYVEALGRPYRKVA